MGVLVIGQNGRALMPTTTRKARILLKENKASVVCRHPFTIHLWYKTGCATQEGSIGIDTGSQHIGVGVTCRDKVILVHIWLIRMDAMYHLLGKHTSSGHYQS